MNGVSNVLMVFVTGPFEFHQIRRADVVQYYGGKVLPAFEMQEGLGLGYSGVGVESILPVKFRFGDSVFQSLDPALEVFITPFNTFRGHFSGMHVTVIKLLLILVVYGNDRLRFHQERRDKVDHGCRPKTGDKEEGKGRKAHPKD